MTSAYKGGAGPAIEPRHRLRIARENAGYEQAELAEIIGVSRGTIGNIEKGRTAIRRIVLNAWCLATGVPVGWALTGGDGPDDDGPGGDGGESGPNNGLRIISSEAA